MTRSLFTLLLAILGSMVATVHAGPVVPGTPTPAVWYDASAITGVANGGAVTTWVDSSGNGNNLSAIGSASTYIAGSPATPGGEPYVKFSNTSMKSITDLPISLKGNLDTTVFIVFSPSPNQAGVFGWGEAFSVAGAAFGLFTNLRPTGLLSVEYAGGQPAVFSAYQPNVPQILEIQKSAGPVNTTTSLAVNNSPPQSPQAGSSGITPTVAGSPFFLGQWVDDPGDGKFFGGISEVIVYDSVLTPTQSHAIEVYLDAKYAIPEPASLVLMVLGATALIAAGRRGLKAVKVAGLLLACCAQSAMAGNVTLPYTQNFGTPAATTAAFQSAYPEFTITGTTNTNTYVVDGSGVLRVTAPDVDIASVTPTNLISGIEVVIKADVTASNSNGAYNSGFAFGNGAGNFNDIYFHPGFGPPFGTPDGTFRVDNTFSNLTTNLGFNQASQGSSTGGTNIDMGYIPANNDPQHMEIDLFANGLVNVKITDSANPSHVFTASFTSIADYGAAVGLRAFPSGAENSQFSNFSITQQTPEPSTFVLGALACVGLIAGARRRQTR